MKAVLSIAGSDSSGRSGIQKADLKTFAAHGCYGTSVITALTAQNTLGIQDIHPCPPEFVANQIHSVLDDLDVHAIKIGMLYDLATTRIVAETLRSFFNGESSMAMPPLICDTVCVSTSGRKDAIEIMITQLFPMAALITPDKTEAELLLTQKGISQNMETLDGMLTAAKILLMSMGSKAVLLKGGHNTITMHNVTMISEQFSDIQIVKHGLYEENMEILSINQDYSQPQLVVDVLNEASGEKTLFVRPRINSSSTRGTGCTLSSSIACGIALGCTLKEAVKKAIAYTHLGMELAQPLVKGHGPLDHFHSISPLLIPRRTPTNPFPLTRMFIQSTSSIWKQYVEHDFVKQLGKGTLNRSSFVHFIKQDYLYLKYYARAYALLGAKSSNFTLIQSSTQTILAILHEIGTHKSFCATFGVTPDELENTPESTATMAYGAYLIDVGLRGDTTKLIMALMACLLGYGEVGLWLQKESKNENTWVIMEGNPYKLWIDDYSGEIYQSAVKAGLENCAIADPPSPERLAEWMGVWERCTNLEKGFWDMALGIL
ncbi:hypothetical protein BYT27DRAFT_7261953 [Phlegmacium glaucopus]|nr:hypothetical protein BYT27DRAFT_7261953 [Phlegmacium glaucopus]